MLVKELQSLALSIKVLDKNGDEIDLRTSYDNDFPAQPDDNKEAFGTVNDVEVGEGYDIDEDSMQYDVYDTGDGADDEDSVNYSAGEDKTFDDDDMGLDEFDSYGYNGSDDDYQ